jgi:glyoxylase-like metal-dependent hydrolase (beta-lactamase superfamily II)
MWKMKIYPFLAIKGYSNSYIVANPASLQAIIIDPGVVSQSMIDILESQNYVLVAALATHNHKSHSEGIDTLKKIYNLQIFAADPNLASGANCILHDNGTLRLAGFEIDFMSLPGHSTDSMIFKIGKTIFTGDALSAGLLGKTTNFYADLWLQRNVLKKIFSQSDYIGKFFCVFLYESIPMLETHLDNRIVQNRYIPFSPSAYPSAWQAEPRVTICG